MSLFDFSDMADLPIWIQIIVGVFMMGITLLVIAWFCVTIVPDMWHDIITAIK